MRLASITNNPSGELEETISQSFIQAAKLRAWLARPDCPPAIRECLALFNKYINHNDELASLVVPGAVADVPRDLVPHTSRKRLTFYARFKLGGSLFCRQSTHVGNSLVVFYLPGSSTPIPGSIKYIFEERGQMRFAVQRQLPADSDVVDPFRHYPHFPARLYSKDLDPNLEIVNPAAVVSHFVRWRFSKDHAVVLMLMKVKFLLHV